MNINSKHSVVSVLKFSSSGHLKDFFSRAVDSSLVLRHFLYWLGAWPRKGFHVCHSWSWFGLDPLKTWSWLDLGYSTLRKIPQNPEMVSPGYFKLSTIYDEIHVGCSLDLQILLQIWSRFFQEFKKLSLDSWGFGTAPGLGIVLDRMVVLTTALVFPHHYHLGLLMRAAAI